MAPSAKRFKSKPMKTVRWSDQGEWSRIITNWSRTFDECLADLQNAHALKLVRKVIPALDVARWHNYYREGPCDVCASSSVSRQVSGALENMTGVKNTFQFCEACFKRFRGGEALHSKGWGEFVLLA